MGKWEKKWGRVGRPIGAYKTVKRYKRTYKFPADIVDFLDSKKTNKTQLIIDALREKYNLPVITDQI